MRYDVIIDPIVKKTFVPGAKPFYLCMLDRNSSKIKTLNGKYLS